MANEDEYNGWCNRETWATALWLGNDQGLDTESRERVALAFARSREEWSASDMPKWSTSVGLRRGGVFLREFVEELLDPEEELISAKERASMARDIGSLWRVDWQAVAEAFAPEDAEVAS